MLKSVLLLLAAVTFGLGISLPLVRLDRFYFFTDTPSLINVISELWTAQNQLLSIIVVLFSMLFPMAKMLTAFHSAMHMRELPSWISILGKWSLMDVLLVAILIFAAKTSGFASAFAQPGMWFYLASTILTAIATSKFVVTLPVKSDQAQTSSRALSVEKRAAKSSSKKPKSKPSAS